MAAGLSSGFCRDLAGRKSPARRMPAGLPQQRHCRPASAGDHAAPDPPAR